jgi:hypothetical protein
VVEGLGAGKDRGVDGPLARDIYITRGGKGRVVSDFAPGHGNRYSRALHLRWVLDMGENTVQGYSMIQSITEFS